MGIVIGNAALAPCAYDWVGGDIDGLAQLSGTLNGYGPQVTAVADALSAQVQQVVGAAGWEGTAASAFTSAWDRDSLTAEAVRRVADQVAGIVGWLAGTLSQIEAGLEWAADQASAHGVPIGADGAPPQVCYLGTGGPGQAAEQWLSDYQVFYAECMQSARSARGKAATALTAMTTQIIDSASNRPADVLGNVTTVGDLLGGLILGDKAPQMGKLIKAIQQAVWYGNGSHTALGRDNPGAEPDDGDLGSLGVLDVLAGVLGTGINTYEDVHDYHRPLLESLYVETFGAEVGLVLPKLPKLISALKTAETAQSEIQGDGAANGETADGEGVAAGVQGGEAAVDGLDPLTLAGLAANDDIHNLFIEHWSTDVDKHGLVAGAVYGYEHATEVETSGDLESNIVEGYKLSLAYEATEAIEHPKAIGEAAEWVADHTPWEIP